MNGEWGVKVSMCLPICKLFKIAGVCVCVYISFTVSLSFHNKVENLKQR